MKVFKFGGASVKNAEAVKNVESVIKLFNDDLVVVISAMGKTTNGLEKVVESYLNKDGKTQEYLQEVKDFHFNILNDLFTDKNHTIFTEIHNTFVEIEWEIEDEAVREYDYVYDQIVSVGEMLSTKIVSAYLNENGTKNTWLDVRNVIQTDNTYRNAKVDWVITEQFAQKEIKAKIDKGQNVIITQGFIGSSSELFTTTLGREGSDFSASILAYCLNAESVTIWKDVPGVLNADPRVFNDTTLLSQISYEEAIEMAFYGASVIHPKTIQPLQNKEIPLYVKSFINPSQPGTRVSKGTHLEPYIPCFIIKRNQILVSISANDFSFMVENNLSYIFKKLHDYKLKVNLIQNSAISFSVCIDNKFGNFDAFYIELKNEFEIDFQKEVDLYTIRHFNETTKAEISQRGKTLLSQTNKETIQIVLQDI